MSDPPKLSFTAVEAEQSIREMGFLSPVIAVSTGAFRLENSEWFALVDEFNRVSHRLIIWVSDKCQGRHLQEPLTVGARVFVRAVQNFQGAILLAERGMTSESESLIRNCYESAFWIGYLEKSGQAALADFENEEHRSELQHLKFIERLASARPSIYSAEQLKLLRRRVSDLSKSVSKGNVKVDKLSEWAGFHDHYLFYKGISGRSAHASMTSVQRHLWRNEAGQYVGHVIGPDGEGIAHVLRQACHAISTACEAVDRLGQGSSEASAIKELDQRCVSLIEASIK